MRVAKEIVCLEFGSHLYGTSTPTSDLDYKSVFIPHAKDILLQRAGRTSKQENTKTDTTAKNTADDIDHEKITLQGFIRLLGEGQTPALDMLFAPKKHWVKSSWEWEFIVAHKNQLIHSGTSAFCGYVRQQAAKYGVKGGRVAAVRQAVTILNHFPGELKLSEIGHEELGKLLGSSEFIQFVNCRGPAGTDELHLEVCNRKVPMHARFKYAREVYQRIFDEYGHRALLAEKNESIDWKALYHAVRVCNEAAELLTTGNITFPRPEAALLLQIRKGELPYRQVAELIEAGEDNVKKLQLTSKLPEKINLDEWNDWIARRYQMEVTRGWED